MIAVLLKAPFYKLYKLFGFPKLNPLSLTISVTRRCNSRCLTCNVWKDHPGKELTIEEYRDIFKGIGTAPFYVTFSGGEPFLRKDFAEVCREACRILKPDAVTIPTNGLLGDKIFTDMQRIIDGRGSARIIVNLSLDGVGDLHDHIRGIPGGFEKVMSTYNLLRRINSPGLQIGFHSVISKYNVHEIPKIYEFVKSVGADSYVTEVAEERVELATIGKEIAPAVNDYVGAADFLVKVSGTFGAKGFARLISAFRKRYYGYVSDIMSGKSAWIPCYAGIASGQINSNGDVWFCCMKAEPVGNLREAGYNFRKIWFSKNADMMRKRIAREKCRCQMANAFYTNILLNPSKLFRL
jgi:MoaA/NifB/PqqE/SkfB family radical SAM enzyme